MAPVFAHRQFCGLARTAHKRSKFRRAVLRLCKRELSMRRVALLLAVVLYVVSGINTFAQTGNASVGGFVQDSTNAYIPGVTVTATNVQTGVVTSAITNESGAYN